MRITDIEAWSVSMKLDEPYTIAYENIQSTTNVFLRIETDRGISGLGCAAPDSEITGENPDSVLRGIDSIVKPYLKGKYPLRYAYGMHYILNI
jgi:L-alanine-DL-glutamate epimerase-like enolase superfamily enzyme